MTYGIQSINASNYVQIDSLAENFAKVSTGTLAAYQEVIDLSGLNLPTDILVFARPAIASRVAGQKYTVEGRLFDQVISNVRQHKVYMKALQYGGSYDGYPIACEYAIVKRSGLYQPSTSGFGLEVLAENGTTLLYSSNNQQFRVVAARQVIITDTGQEWTGGDFNTSWYIGDITEAYALLGPYDTYYYEIYSLGYIGGSEGGTEVGEAFIELSNTRSALFNYPDNKFGTVPRNYYGQVSGTPVTKTASGIKTEMIGLII